MPGPISDFLFGKKVLQSAAQGSTPAAPAPVPASSSGIDVAAEAQKAADRAKAAKPAGPLATPMTPQTKMGASKAKQ